MRQVDPNSRMNLAELKEKVDSAHEQVTKAGNEPSDVAVTADLLFNAEIGFNTEYGKTFESRSTEIIMENLEIQDTDFDGDTLTLNLREE